MRDYYKGMDVSSLPELEERGVLFKDFDGSNMDPFDLMKKYGVNAVRLRLWNNPENVEEAKGYCDLEHTISMAKRIKEHDMSFMLDFHYSDFWADPGQQRKPKAWEKLNFDELKKAMYMFTRDTLLKLKENGVLPEIVQIGNEIRSGLLFPEGELPDYVHMVELVNAGISAARTVANTDTMKVMIHLDQGGRYFYLKEWFEKSMEAGLLDFDLIGLSYYPFWHGTFMDLRDTLIKLISDYEKPIMIVETAHAWRRSKQGFIDESQERVAGIPATPEGQRRVLDFVNNITASLPDNMGLGVYYWEPLCVPNNNEGGWSENMGILDETGRVMESVHAFEFSRGQLRAKEAGKVYEPDIIKILEGERPVFPEKVPVLFFDGTLEKREVVWQIPQDTWELGEYVISGEVQGIDLPVCCKVMVVKEIPQKENLIKNSNWESGFAQWEKEQSDASVWVQFFPEYDQPFPAPPINALRFEAPKNFVISISQQIEITKEGYYTLQVEYRGADTTNVEIALFVKTADKSQETKIHPTEHAWDIYEVNMVWCKTQTVTVGIRISSPPIYGMMRKFSFFLEETKE